MSVPAHAAACLRLPADALRPVALVDGGAGIHNSNLAFISVVGNWVGTEPDRERLRSKS